MPKPVIVSAVRTAIGTSFKGSLVNTPPEILATTILQEAVRRSGVEPADMPVVRRIVKKAAQNDYRFASIIQGIVESAPFQMRTKLEPAETVNSVTRARVE